MLDIYKFKVYVSVSRKNLSSNKQIVINNNLFPEFTDWLKPVKFYVK